MSYPLMPMADLPDSTGPLGTYMEGTLAVQKQQEQQQEQEQEQ